MTGTLAKWAAALDTFDGIKHQFQTPGQVEKALNSIPLDERVLLFRGSDSDIIERLSAYDKAQGSNVNQEVVKMAAAGAAEILRPQVVKETVAEAVVILAKRQRYTLTRLPDIGQHILNESVPHSAWFEENLAGFDEQAANTFLRSPLGVKLQRQWAAASEEKDLQDGLNAMIPEILTCHGLAGNRTYHDTHASGLRGAEVRIDCTITDGPRSPAHVITYAEAKFKLQSTSERDEAVGQIWQRVDQLASDQDMRETWTVAIISHKRLQLWQLRHNQNRCKHTALLPFSLSASSAGFQMICRWLASDPQALGYLPPHLPTIHIGNEVMRPAAKVFQNSSAHDSANMLNGKVMVFTGTLSDGQEAIAKLPATEAYLDREVANLKMIAGWPELQNCFVLLRDIGRYDNQERRMLILQPVGCLIPYKIEIDALLDLMKQFAGIVGQLAAKGFLHGDLSYYNVLKRQDTNDALLVDMQTLMTLAQAVETGFTTGTPLFMGWNVIRKRGHLVSTELESLLYVLIFVLTGGILPWRHTPFEDHNLAATVFGIMASDEFSERVLKRVPRTCHDMLNRLRRLFFPADYATDVTPERFISELHL